MPADLPPGGGTPRPAGEPGRRVTIRDVAAHAGVSIGTASKALNGQGKLRAETRDRVAAAARALGFAPNALARGLLSGRTYTVGMITTDSFGRFSIPVMLGAEDALGAGQISVFMCDTRDEPERERRYLDMLLSRRVDGLIVAGRRIEPRPSVGTGLGVPVVYTMTQSMDGDEPAILPDDIGGGQLAAGHLLGLGRRRLAHITGPERFLAARKRARGFCAAAAAAGAGPRPADVLYGEWSEAWGRAAARMALAGDPAVDGIFCGSDQIARGVCDTLRLLGRRVPDDIAVVGYDNWAPLVLGADPPLTSVEPCLEEVGRMAAEHLLRAIDGEPTHGVHIVPGRVVVRGSTVPEPGPASTRGAPDRPGAAPGGRPGAASGSRPSTTPAGRPSPAQAGRRGTAQESRPGTAQEGRPSAAQESRPGTAQEGRPGPAQEGRPGATLGYPGRGQA